MSEEEVLEILDGIRDLIEASKTKEALARIDAIAGELEDDIEADEEEADEDEEDTEEEVPEEEHEREESIWH